MASELNALAELAERLDAMPVRGKHCRAEILDLGKAQRIVAELAKITYMHWIDGEIPHYGPMRDAVLKCRAIAEKGANDGSR